MRYFFLSIIFFLFYFSLCGQDKPENEAKIVTQRGVIYKGMPKEELQKLGFINDILISYNKEGNQEYITFFDWTTPGTGDNITFYVVEGRVKNWFRGKAIGTIGELEKR